MLEPLIADPDRRALRSNVENDLKKARIKVREARLDRAVAERDAALAEIDRAEANLKKATATVEYRRKVFDELKRLL